MVEHAKTQLYKATKDYRFLSFIGNGVVLHEYISIIMWRNVEKNTFWHVRPMQTRISLSIRAVWSEYFARIENPIPLSPSPPTHTPSWISKMRQEKIQVWLPECTSWSESALLSDWTFSDIAAKIVLCIFLLFEQSFVIFSSPCSPPSPPPPPPPTPVVFFPFQGGSSVAVLSLCIGGFIYGVCVVLICSSSFLTLVPPEGCASWLWHFLDIFS